MVFPFKDINRCRLTATYGMTGNGWSCGRHQGVDLVSDGDPTVISVAEGKIIRSKYTPDGWGQYVVAELPDGRAIVYGHLVKGSQRVVTGDLVRVGQTIGTMGSSGHSSGKHLHLELQKKYYDPCLTDDITVFLGIKNVITGRPGQIKLLKEASIMTADTIRIALPDGDILELKGYVVDGKSYLPLREVLEKLGHRVDWQNGMIAIGY